MPDWSQLPEELLDLIFKNLDKNCFDVVHARSVCTLWRSLIPFPSCLLRPSYTFPAFPRESEDFYTFKKVPLFLFRVKTPLAADVALPPEYFLGPISRDESDDHIKVIPSPLQCSVKVKIPGSDPTLINMNDCQIIPLGHQYRMIGKDYNLVGFLPLDKERGGGGGEFVVLRSFIKDFMILTSVEMRWKQLLNIPNGRCTDIVTFKGRFYATFSSRKIVAIDPYSLEVTLLLPSPQGPSHLVPSGNDELFLVESTCDRPYCLSRLTYRVSRLDEEAGKWVEVSDLGDRVLFIGQQGNFSCSAKEIPHGCGLSGNSILYTFLSLIEVFPYKYGVHTENAEDDLHCWRFSRENRVIILNKSFSILAFRVER
ncbi:hypothetical protein CARUB_v10023469mg [Capsella rubella]|uniref:F-box domain-containing protein n=1 Tax=Capsella rubella TaxID=81985 RepID=R0HPZ2_9BRAS|nr:hypothetical protein CARUB_v10023469mg [Capsella rubella]